MHQVASLFPVRAVVRVQTLEETLRIQATLHQSAKKVPLTLYHSCSFISLFLLVVIVPFIFLLQTIPHFVISPFLGTFCKETPISTHVHSYLSSSLNTQDARHFKGIRISFFTFSFSLFVSSFPPFYSRWLTSWSFIFVLGTQQPKSFSPPSLLLHTKQVNRRFRLVLLSALSLRPLFEWLLRCRLFWGMFVFTHFFLYLQLFFPFPSFSLFFD